MVFRFLRSPTAGGRQQQQQQQQNEASAKESVTVDAESTGDQGHTDVATVLAADGDSSAVPTSTAIPTPALSEADELFFRELFDDAEIPPSLPPRPAVTPETRPAGSESQESNDGLAAKRKWADFIWDNLPSTPSMPDSLTWRATSSDKERIQAADDLMAAAMAVRLQQSETEPSSNITTAADHEDTRDEETVDQDQAQQRRDLDATLKNVNFAAVNDRIVSLSDDSQLVLQRFTLILRDMVNGVPTAYRDFDSLFTEKHAQLDRMYRSMPTPVQSLIRTELRSWWKVTYPKTFFYSRKSAKTVQGDSKDISSSTGEAVKASSASHNGEVHVRLNDASSSDEKTGKAVPASGDADLPGRSSGQTSSSGTAQTSSSGTGQTSSSGAGHTSSSDTPRKTRRSSIVSFKRLIPGRGAMVAMLQSILAFLRTRFPLLLAGSNLLVGFAVLILLLVCWYCYSRGREARLASEEQDQKPGMPATTPETSEQPVRLPSSVQEDATEDTASLLTLQSFTTLEESSRLATVHDAAAQVKLPNAVPLPAASSSNITEHEIN